MAENFPNLRKETDTQMQKPRSSKKMNLKRPKHGIIKLSKVKTRRKSKQQEINNMVYKENPIRLLAGFSTETEG